MTDRIRYLLDENIAQSVRSQLLFHAPALDVLRIGDDNAPAYGTPDLEILAWIEQNGTILVSRNRRTMPDHLKTHLGQGHHVPGILLMRRHVALRQMIEELLLIWEASEPSEYIDHIRYLPL